MIRWQAHVRGGGPGSSLVPIFLMKPFFTWQYVGCALVYVSAHEKEPLVRKAMKKRSPGSLSTGSGALPRVTWSTKTAWVHHWIKAEGDNLGRENKFGRGSEVTMELETGYRLPLATPYGVRNPKSQYSMPPPTLSTPHFTHYIKLPQTSEEQFICWLPKKTQISYSAPPKLDSAMAWEAGITCERDSQENPSLA